MFNSSLSIISKNTFELEKSFNGSIKSISEDDAKHTNAITLLRSLTKTSFYTDDGIATSTVSFSDTISDNDNNVINDSKEIALQCETRYSDQFKDKVTHFFVLSQSGKPIFSRYGSDSQTATIIGVMQAMISFVEAGDDKLKIMVAGHHTFLFLCRDNIILVAVSSGEHDPSQLKMILLQLYHQIISMLTIGAISTAFKKQPNLDLRRLLVGIDCYLHGIIEQMESEMGPFMEAINFIAMDDSVRSSMINTVCKAIKVNEVVFAILLLDGQLVGIARHKDVYLHPMDAHLILNIINNVVHFNSQICWLPVCLPRFDPHGYLYAHISYIVPRLSLVILTVNPEQFDLLQSKHNSIRYSMLKNEIVKRISTPYSPDMLFKSFQLMEVQHFVYKARGLSQYISYLPSYNQNCYNSKSIVSRYLRLLRLIYNPMRRARLVYQNTSENIILAWHTERFELYAMLDAMNSKTKIMEIVRRLLAAIDKHYDYYFVNSFPTF